MVSGRCPEHRPDTMTADETFLAATIQEQPQEAVSFEGSSGEKKAEIIFMR